MYFLQKDDIMLHFTLNGIFRHHCLSIFTFLFTWKVLQDINLDLLGSVAGYKFGCKFGLKFGLRLNLNWNFEVFFKKKMFRFP